MRKNKFRKIWLSISRSVWYPAIIAVLPNLILSFVWSYGRIEGVFGLITNFVAIEGLVIILTIVMRPLLQAEKILNKANIIEMDTPEEKMLISRIKAKIPHTDFFNEWALQFPRLKESWANLTQVSVDMLCSENLSTRNINTVIDTFNLASAQIKGGRPFDISSLKRAASYLSHQEASEVTKVLVINRINPALWFTPEMVIYMLDLYRNFMGHPERPKFIRISICDIGDINRINNPRWRINLEVDPLKAYIALNQIAEVDAMSLLEERFDDEVSNFISSNLKRIKEIGGENVDEMVEYIKDVAFIMYCKGEEPIKAFRGRPYIPSHSAEQQTKQIMWPEINRQEYQLYYDLFYSLLAASNPIPTVNLSEIYS